MTPMIASVIEEPMTLWKLTAEHWTKLAAELRTLLTERDRLQDQLIQRNNELLEARANASPNPPRRLRPYKGVTYQNGYWHMEGAKFGAHEKDPVCAMIRCSNTLTDADHAALLALRDDPYLPVETLEDVVEKFSEEVSWMSSDSRKWLCDRLRAHLSQQTPWFVDREQPLTAAEHIKALRNLGATKRRKVTGMCLSNGLNVALTGPADVLILPPDVELTADDVDRYEVSP